MLHNPAGFKESQLVSLPALLTAVTGTARTFIGLLQQMLSVLTIYGLP